MDITDRKREHLVQIKPHTDINILDRAFCFTFISGRQRRFFVDTAGK